MMFAEGGDNCPIVSLKLYISKLNKNCDAFFQKPRPNFCYDDTTWYCNMPLGKCTLENMMKNISKCAKLSRVFTNHCIRTTVSTVLGHAGVDSRNICAITGHKSEQSLKSYISGPSNDQRAHMSEILFNYGKSNEKDKGTVVTVDCKRKPTCTITSSSSYESDSERSVMKPVCMSNNLQGETEMAIDKPVCVSSGIPSLQHSLGSLFSGAVFGDNASINVNIYTNTSSNNCNM